jgi:hypothetical protein
MSGIQSRYCLLAQTEDVVDNITRSFASFLNVRPPASTPTSPNKNASREQAKDSPEILHKARVEVTPGISKDKGKGRAIHDSASAAGSNPDIPHQGSSFTPSTADADFRFGTSSWVEPADPHYNKGELLFCKSQVYVHPSKKRDDNIPGYLGLASVQSSSGEGAQAEHASGVILFWVPASVVEALNEEDVYHKVSARAERVLKVPSKAEDAQKMSDTSMEMDHDVDGKWC